MDLKDDLKDMKLSSPPMVSLFQFCLWLLVDAFLLTPIISP